MVTDDVTGQVEIKMFEDLSFLVLCRTIIVSTVNPMLSLRIFMAMVIKG